LIHHSDAGNPGDDPEVLFQSALKADPNLAEAWYQLGCLQQSRGDWTGSVASLERAVSLRPAYAEAHYRLVRAYAHSSRREDSQHEIALQQRYSQEAKNAENQKMKDVITFITNSH